MGEMIPTSGSPPAASPAPSSAPVAGGPGAAHAPAPAASDARRAGANAASTSAADLGRGQQGAGHVERAAGHGHLLDEARDAGRAARRSRHSAADLAVVEALDRDRVDLDRGEAGGARRLDAGEHAGKIAPAGDGGEALGVQRVEADVQAVDAGRAQRARPARPAGGRWWTARCRRRPGIARSRRTRSTRSRRTVGSPPVRRTRAHAQPHEAARPAPRSPRSQDVGAVDVADAVLGQAIGAAVVAAVGDRDAQVVDDPALPVQERRCRFAGFSAGRWGWSMMVSDGRARRVPAAAELTTCASSGRISRSIASRPPRASPAAGTPRAADDAGAGARQHRGRADLLERQHAEQLAETVDGLVETSAPGPRPWYRGAAMPVPPVSNDGAPEPAATSASPRHDLRRIVAHDDRTLHGEPGRAHGSRMRRPPSSVASVRVSETVIAAIRTRSRRGGALVLGDAHGGQVLHSPARTFESEANRQRRQRRQKRAEREPSRRRRAPSHWASFRARGCGSARRGPCGCRSRRC